jgi:hypothetical protein
MCYSKLKWSPNPAFVQIRVGPQTRSNKLITHKSNNRVIINADTASINQLCFTSRRQKGIVREQDFVVERIDPRTCK